MPFPMTHMCIADEMLRNTTKIKNTADFMLGAVAPDSVHSRASYVSSMKKTSHMCMGEGNWGELTNNKEWLENVITFLKNNKTAANRDFLYGYCAHIIADIENNIKIWTPFRLKNAYAFENGGMSDYHSESRIVDHALFMQHTRKVEMQQLLEKGICYDIPGVAIAEDIAKMRNNLIHNQYVEKEIEDMSRNRFITLDSIQRFISEEAVYIAGVLFE